MLKIVAENKYTAGEINEREPLLGEGVGVLGADGAQQGRNGERKWMQMSKMNEEETHRRIRNSSLQQLASRSWASQPQTGPAAALRLCQRSPRSR